MRESGWRRAAALGLCLAAPERLRRRGTRSPAAGGAAVPAAVDNWGLSFPEEGETPVGNAGGRGAGGPTTRTTWGTRRKR